MAEPDPLDPLPAAAEPPDPARAVRRALEIRTYDIDFAGIVSNIVFIRWLEDLRLALMDEAYPIATALAEGVAPLLLRTRIAYRRPVTIADRLEGRMWVPAMGKLRWQVAAVFVVGETIAAAALQTGIFIRLADRRPVPPPAPLRARFGA
jgi:acyl-CoA thioester hydrolase